MGIARKSAGKFLRGELLRGKPLRGRPLWAAAVLALASVFASGTEPPAKSEETAEPNRALTVVVSPVRSRPVRRTVAATGTVTAWRELVIGAETGGLGVTEVLVDEGDSVKRGQVLARLNDAVLQAQLRQNQAALAEAQATLQGALSDLRRGQELTERQAISQQAAEQRLTAARTAEARVASVQAARAELEAKLAQTRILAPADGTVSKRSVHPGQVVQTGAELLRLVSDGRLEVDALVPESELTRLAPKQAVTITDAASRAIRGTLRAVAPVVDARTRLATVHIALPPDSGLRPGMFARVEIETEAALALVAPQDALVWRNGEPGVLTVARDVTEFRPVRTGSRQGGEIEILDGLRPGERIVTAGAGFVKEGDRVRIEVADAEPAR